MTDPHHLENIKKTAERVLSKHFGDKIQLQTTKSFAISPQKKSSIVIRCQIKNNTPTLPKTVIVKKVREDSHAGAYLPDSEERNAAHLLFNDWAALELFDRINHPLSLLPKFYGGDHDTGTLVMEDLGNDETQSLYPILNGNNREIAEAALINYATALGNMHAQTVGKSDLYNQIRTSLGPLPKHNALYETPWESARPYRATHAEIQIAIQAYHATFTQFDAQPHPNVGIEIETITRQVAEHTGPMLAFCQGDQNGVGGYIITNNRGRFYDFDCGNFRHALLEGVPYRTTWGGMITIPKSLYPQMDKAYQNAFAQGYPPISDDAYFYKTILEATAYWNIYYTITRVPQSLRVNPKQPIAQDYQRGPSSIRQQVIAWLETFTSLSEQHGHWPALGESAQTLSKCLRKHWPPEAAHLPTFPVFKESL